MRRETYMNFAKKFKSPPIQTTPVIVREAGLDKDGGALKSLNDDMKPREGEEEGDKKRLSKALKKLHKLSNDELEVLLASEDNFVIDCLLDSVPEITKLKREQESLQKQVADMAKFNYAREPDFVRDRLQLRKVLEEASTLKKRLASKHVAPIFNKLDKALSQLSLVAREHEELSEQVAHEFLEGTKGYDEFLNSYINVRKEAIRKRILVDKLAKEKSRLSDNLSKPIGDPNSPVPMPRQRKRVSFNR